MNFHYHHRHHNSTCVIYHNSRYTEIRVMYMYKVIAGVWPADAFEV